MIELDEFMPTMDFADFDDCFLFGCDSIIQTQKAVLQTTARNENSHLIQVYANTSTVWRGREWPTLNLDIKIGKEIRLSDKTYTLRAVVQNCTSKEEFYPQHTDSIRIKFAKNLASLPCRTNLNLDKSKSGSEQSTVMDKDPWEANVVKNDCYNTLHVDIHKDLFNDGDKFRVLVVAHQHCCEGSNIFGASEPIS